MPEKDKTNKAGKKDLPASHKAKVFCRKCGIQVLRRNYKSHLEICDPENANDLRSKQQKTLFEVGIGKKEKSNDFREKHDSDSEMAIDMRMQALALH